MVSRQSYITLARHRRLTDQRFADKEVQHLLSIICSSITGMMELIVNKVFDIFLSDVTIRTVYKNVLPRV